MFDALGFSDLKLKDPEPAASIIDEPHGVTNKATLRVFGKIAHKVHNTPAALSLGTTSAAGK